VAVLEAAAAIVAVGIVILSYALANDVIFWLWLLLQQLLLLQLKLLK
jgi:hypothetical protein